MNWITVISIYFTVNTLIAWRVMRTASYQALMVKVQEKGRRQVFFTLNALVLILAIPVLYLVGRISGIRELNKTRRKKMLKETHIKLNSHEIQSRLSQVRNAEGLISQLPIAHEGRNTWIMIYGQTPEAVALRASKGLGGDSGTQSAGLAGAEEPTNTWIMNYGQTLEAEADAKRMRWLLDGNGYFMEEEMLCGHENCTDDDRDKARRTIDAAMAKRGEQEPQKTTLRDTVPPPSDSKTHCMVDLETIGNGYDGIFTTLGACMFDPETGEIGETFYESIDWQSAVDAGRTITPDTVKWWMSQEPDAVKEILKEGLPLATVLGLFEQWLPEHREDIQIWGNGPNFDIGKLETAYGYENIPWPYYAPRCVRTVRELARGTVSKDDVPFTGTKHNALDDAIHQAQYVSVMWQALRNGARKV